MGEFDTISSDGEYARKPQHAASPLQVGRCSRRQFAKIQTLRLGPNQALPLAVAT